MRDCDRHIRGGGDEPVQQDLRVLAAVRRVCSHVDDDRQAQPVCRFHDLPHLTDVLRFSQVDVRNAKVQLESLEAAARCAALQLRERVILERTEAAERDEPLRKNVYLVGCPIVLRLDGSQFRIRVCKPVL